MSSNTNPMEGGGEKCLPETSVTSVPHNLATIQSMQSVQTVQNIVQSNIQTIQPVQSVIGTVVTSNALVGKSVSLDLNPKLSLMKPVVQGGVVSSTDASKITTTLCSVGSTVRIISPGMLSAVERQTQQAQQVQPVTAQQIVTSIPAATYHVPRGPAAVANIAAPRSTVATPIVRASTGQSVPSSRPGISTTVPNPQWQPKTTSVVYAQPQRHVVPPGTRITTRPPAAVYSGQQPRLVTPAQGRPVQATMVTGIQGTPSRLIAPVLQTNNNITRIPVAQIRPPTAQVSSITTTVQPGRATAQSLQSNQTARPLTAAGTVNRIAVTPVLGPTNRITSATSVTVQPTGGKQLTINPTTGSTTANFSRIVLPQQVQQQSQSQGAPRVVQTVTSLSNIGAVSRVIATTASAAGNVARVSQPTSTPVARITGMALHSLPLAPTRTTSTTVKTIPAQSIAQTIQIKPAVQQHQSSLRITPANSSSISGASGSGNNSNNTTTLTNNSNNSNNNIATGPTQAVQSLYLNSPQTTTTYYSVESSGVYSQYRPATVQPVRLLVEPTNYEETHTKPNASPRPSILRKRDHDNSPAKSAAKNLVPVLAALPSVASTCSPPGSPRGERGGDGCQSSGSTTVSATSSPGLDEEPEQSRIPINQTMEMSPRKKPRKQQLTCVELTESRYNDEEMQFITEEKLKIKDEPKDKFERKQMMNVQQHDGRLAGHQPAVVMRSRPTPSLLRSSWKNRSSSRLHHYRRPGDVRPREERRPTVAELAQQQHVLQKINGWKVYHLTAQMEDLAELEKQVHEKLKTTLVMLESQQIGKNRQDDGLERANELIKGNMQRSSLISEGMNEARTQLVAIFQHKGHVTDILQRCGNKRAQKKRDK